MKGRTPKTMARSSGGRIPVMMPCAYSHPKLERFFFFFESTTKTYNSWGITNPFQPASFSASRTCITECPDESRSRDPPKAI
jgi:hypothetical protein